MKWNFSHSLKRNEKTVKNGLVAAALTAMVLAVAVLANLVVGALPQRFTSADISLSGMFTLSDTTGTVLDGLTKDTSIHAYYLAQNGSEDTNITRLLDCYAGASHYFTWEQRDPVLYPDLAGRYEGASTGCVVVTGGGKYQVLSYSPDLYELDLEAYYYGTQQYKFAAENAITTAIGRVLQTKSYLFYELTGHGESTLSDDFVQTLGNSGIALEELNLLSMGGIPEDADALLINGPQYDLGEAEAAALETYLQQGGKLLLTTDVGMETPHLDEVLAASGMTRQTGLVVENDSNRYAYQMPQSFLLPFMEDNAITAGVTGGVPVYAPLCHGILYEEVMGYTYTPLLTSSTSSYAMQEYQTAETAQQGENDPDGPFTLALAAQNETTGVQIVWIGSPNLFLTQIDEQVAGGNGMLLGSIANWLTGQESGPVIESRSMTADSLSVPGGAAVGLGVVFTLLIPLVCLVVGAVVCLLRRRK